MKSNKVRNLWSACLHERDREESKRIWALSLLMSKPAAVKLTRKQHLASCTMCCHLYQLMRQIGLVVWHIYKLDFMQMSLDPRVFLYIWLATRILKTKRKKFTNLTSCKRCWTWGCFCEFSRLHGFWKRIWTITFLATQIK